MIFSGEALGHAGFIAIFEGVSRVVLVVPPRYKSIPTWEGAINERKMAIQTRIQFSVVSLVPLEGSRVLMRYNAIISRERIVLNARRTAQPLLSVPAGARRGVALSSTTGGSPIHHT